MLDNPFMRQKGILEKLKNGMSRDEILKDNADWSIFYHLSPMRRNLLSWMDMDKTASTLEIGGGCGAITELLCERTGEVDVLELADDRAFINQEINKNKKNLNIIIGSFDQLPQMKRYDYITMIGSLEYSNLYMKSRESFADMLKKAGELLQEKGQLILAIENRFGMKYWAGAREDHTGRFFEGLAGYENTSNIRTFSKEEITVLLKDCGYKSMDFYYPLPDYKTPLMIYSDEYLPKPGEIRGIMMAFDQDRLQLFNEEAVYDSICRDGMFGYFSNSFLVIARREG